ncbi:lysozyme C-like [Triplophysa dalaica]|uniref:lysozyme C-like n=1 Tax=Triplophysa dalaica TaxID=1582913 RepID=UPI0024DF577D|nr:lysozyme C-like [Triplophysa dalaica]
MSFNTYLSKCFEKLIRDFICSVLPASLDPLQLAYSSNCSTDDAIAFRESAYREETTGFRSLDFFNLSGYKDIFVADYYNVCLTQWESSFNATATNHNTDGSTDYMIFQINSRYWCHDDHTPGRTSNGCDINCYSLLSKDISLSVNCAKIIARQEGISAWYGWKNHCRNQDVSRYIAGCGL